MEYGLNRFERFKRAYNKDLRLRTALGQRINICPNLTINRKALGWIWRTFFLPL
jgi:hypothetical protein